MNLERRSENREDVPKTESLQLEAAPLNLSFPEVFRANAPFAWRCLRRLGVAQSDADDVCQEVFLVVHRKLPEFDGRASLRAWIYGICVKKASDHRRLAHKKREKLSDQTPDTESLTSGPDASLDSKRALRKLDDVLDSLDDDKRAAFVLYEIEGLSLQDVAASCNCPLQTVYSRLAAARRHVEAALAESRKGAPMSEDEEPARLSLESSGSSSALRRALSAAKDDLPAPDHVEAMLARFPIPMAGPGGGGGGAPIAGAAGVGTTVKIIGGLAIATIIGGGTYLVTRSDPSTPVATAPVAVVSATVVATVATAAPSVVIEPAPTMAMTESASAMHSVKVARPTTAVSAEAPRPEMDILKEARAAAQSNPSRALQLVNEHANGYPKSGMAQEREMIRIQALLNQGKRAEAKALADAFKKAHPNSAYSQRLDSMF